MNAEEPNPLAPVTSLVMEPSSAPVRLSISVLPAPTVNLWNEQHLSVRLPEKLTVIVVPVLTVPVASNFHIDTVAPTAAAADGALVYSLSLDQSPVPPEGSTWLSELPSAVAMLSLATVRMPMSPAASEFVTVTNVKVELLVLFAPVPSVPTAAIAI